MGFDPRGLPALHVGGTRTPSRVSSMAIAPKSARSARSTSYGFAMISPQFFTPMIGSAKRNASSCAGVPAALKHS